MRVWAIVRLELDALDGRHFRLPGDGTRSLIYVFGDAEQVGARASTADGRDLTPGSTHDSVRLDFWAPQAGDVVHVGRAFEIWYGGTVGRGSVESVGHYEPKESR